MLSVSLQMGINTASHNTSIWFGATIWCNLTAQPLDNHCDVVYVVYDMLVIAIALDTPKGSRHD